MMDEEDRSRQRRALEDAARWKAQALATLKEEARKAPAERDEARIRDTLARADRAALLRSVELAEPLAETCKPLSAWGTSHPRVGCVRRAIFDRLLVCGQWPGGRESTREYR